MNITVVAKPDAPVADGHKRSMLHAPYPLREHSKPLGRSGVIAVVAALVLLLTIVGASIWQSSRNAEALARAQATRAQRNTVSGIMLAAEDAETAQRGFLLTTDPDYLQPLVSAEQQLPTLLATVTAAWPADPRVRALAASVMQKLGELRQTISMAQGGNLPGALSVVRTNVGRTLMLQIRATVHQLEGELDAVLVGEVAAITGGGRLLVAIDLAGLVMVLALAALIALGLQGYVDTVRLAQATMDKANATLARNNEVLDETVRARTADLLAANAEIQRFAYIVSHDLRAPLVNIMGFTSELEQAAATLERNLDPEAQAPELLEAVRDEIPEALRFIKSSTSKMDRLINAILKLSREGRRVLAPERLDMVEMLRAMSDSMQHQATQRQAVIEIGQLPDLTADRLAVEQVFSNVIDNALKYLAPGRPGLIRVEGRAEGAMRRYDIVDNGRGIAERDFERVFELFRRAGDQTVPGEGIGLAHVRALVRRLGGSIDCTSKLGVGTTFTIELPAVAQHVMENAA